MTQRANSEANVSTGKPKASGAYYRAPAGTTLPTDATTALAAAYVNVGFIGPDGVTETPSQTVKKHTAWGGKVIETSSEEYAMQLKVKFVEVNTDTQGIIWGDANVTGTDDAMTIVKGVLSQDESVTVVETLMKGSKVSRKVYPRTKLNSVASVVYKDNEIVGFEATLDCLWDDAIGGFSKEFIGAPSTSGGGD